MSEDETDEQAAEGTGTDEKTDHDPFADSESFTEEKVGFGSEATDPFERLGETVEERDGDPFEQLESAVESEQADTTEDFESRSQTEFETGSPETERSDRFDDSLEAGTDATPDQSEFVPESIDELDTTERDGDPFSSLEGAFEKAGAGSVDPDVVWKSLEGAQEQGSVAEKAGRTYSEVSKHSYCEQCEHFSDPPNVHCANEGTEIVEFPDLETVRVVDCPVVERRKRLEEET